MKKLYGILVVFLLFLGVSGFANANTLDFEDLSGQAALSTNYAGLTWDSNWTYYDFDQPPYNASSGDERIYTHNYGGWIDFGQEVTFLGSWVASTDQGQQMYWEGYRNGDKIYESTHLYGGNSAFINVNWSNVDYVNFVSTSYNHFIIDDISYNTNAAPVPEPATMLLLGSGIIGLAGFRRKFFKK